jgi:hypothetical protein
MSARYLPIGEKLVDIRRLAKMKIGEKKLPQVGEG